MAFFRKAADIFALDIGSSSVKALQLREAGGSYRLTALGTASLPPEAIADGSIKDAPTVIEAIRSSVSKSGIKARETAIAITSMTVGASLMEPSAIASGGSEAIADGSIKDAPTVIEAIRSSVSKSGIKAREPAIALTSMTVGASLMEPSAIASGGSEAIADGSIKDAPTVIEAIRSSVSKSGIKARETELLIAS